MRLGRPYRPTPDVPGFRPRPRGVCSHCRFALPLTGRGFVDNHKPRVYVGYRGSAEHGVPTYLLSVDMCAGAGVRPVSS